MADAHPMEVVVTSHVPNNSIKLPIFFQPEGLQDRFHALPRIHGSGRGLIHEEQARVNIIVKLDVNNAAMNTQQGALLD
jgi:hypothetical protein